MNNFVIKVPVSLTQNIGFFVKEISSIEEVTFTTNLNFACVFSKNENKAKLKNIISAVTDIPLDLIETADCVSELEPLPVPAVGKPLRSFIGQEHAT